MKMALSEEQQQAVEYEMALFNAREVARTKIEMVRLAKEVLIENARSKPVDSRDVSAADIEAFAQTLVTYING